MFVGNSLTSVMGGKLKHFQKIADFNVFRVPYAPEIILGNTKLRNQRKFPHQTEIIKLRHKLLPQNVQKLKFSGYLPQFINIIVIIIALYMRFIYFLYITKKQKKKIARFARCDFVQMAVKLFRLFIKINAAVCDFLALGI